MSKHCLSKIVLIAILLLATTTQAFAQQPTTAASPSKSVQFNLNSIPSSQDDGVTQKSPSAIPISLSITVNSTNNNTIKGNLNFENGFLDTIPNLYYQVTLVPKKTTENIGGIVAYTISKPIYTIKSQTTQSLPFELISLPNIPSGDYELQALVGTVSKPILINNSVTLTLTGNSTYFEVAADSCAVVSDNKSYDTNIAPPFNPQQAPVARCTLINTQNKTVVATQNVAYAVRTITANPEADIKQIKNNTAISFRPNERKEVFFSLPALETPQVYSALAMLVDENNNPLSTNISFRWTVRGPSARISTVSLNNNYYQKGDTANVGVAVSSSMDIFWRENGTPQEGTSLQQPQLQATITDEQGIVCGTKEHQLPTLEGNAMVWPIQTINVPITRECTNPKVEVKLLDQGKILAEKSIQRFAPPSEIATTPWYANPFIILSIAAIAIIVIAIITTIIIGKRRKKPLEAPPATPIVALLITGALLLVFSTTLAQHVFAAKTIYPYTFNRDTDKPPLYYDQTYDGSLSEEGEGAQTTVRHNIDGQMWVIADGQDNHGDTFQGNFWTPGSKVKTLSADTIEVTAYGTMSGYGCENVKGGFEIISRINGDENNVEISNIEMLELGSAFSRYETYTRSNTGIITFSADNQTYGVTAGDPGRRQITPNKIFIHTDHSQGSVKITYQVKKTNGSFGPQDVYSAEGILMADEDFSAYSDSDSNRPVRMDDGTLVKCGGVNDGCTVQADIPIPGGYLEGANGATCTVTGWAALPATQYPSSGRKQADVEIWSFSSNPPTLVKRFTPNANRTDLGGRFGFSENLNGLLANNQQYNLGIYAVQGNGSDKLWTGLKPLNDPNDPNKPTITNPITLTCTGTTGTPTPTPTPGKTTCITPGLSTTPRIDPLEDILRVDAILEGKGAGPGIKATYGVSGLNAGDPNLTPGIVSGDNYYNALKIQPIFTSNERDLNQLSLVGSAFTGTGGNKPAGSTLRDLVNSAQAGGGFVVIYANPRATNLSANGKIQEAGFDFTPGSYYIIYNNTLIGPLTNKFIPIETVKSDGTSTTILEAQIGTGPNKTPWAPGFNIRLYQPLGNHIWGTYIYLKYGSTSLAEPKNPLNSLSSQSAYNNSTNCIQAN